MCVWTACDQIDKYTAAHVVPRTLCKIINETSACWLQVQQDATLIYQPGNGG